MESAMQRLRRETRPEHDAIERVLLASGFLDGRAPYIAWLRRMLGLYEVVETELAGSSDLGAALPDLPARRKVPWLVEDLRALGEPSVDDAPRIAARTCVAGPEAFGCAYVVEGATLGGRVLAAQARASMGLEAGSGATFLAGYGRDTGPKWRAFGAALDRYASDDATADAIVAGARDTFVRMRAWLVAP